MWAVQAELHRNTIAAKATGLFPLSPQQLWALLAATESRDVFRVDSRQQLSNVDGRITELVVFEAPVRILFWKKWARTQVHQTIDMSDPSNVTVQFNLVRSDLMSRLVGSWHFQLLEPATKGSLGRTQVTYCFEMWPKGVPTALRYMPGLVDAVKAAVLREASQLFDKLAFVAAKVQPGTCLLEAARQASAEVVAAGGSFKCLQLQRAGRGAEAAAAAAAEAAARLELKQQQQRVVCHALDDVSEDGEDDCVMQLDSCGSNISNLSSLSSGSCVMAVDGFSEPGSSQGRSRSSSSSSSSSGTVSSSRGRVSAAGSADGSSDGSMGDGLVDQMSASFSTLLLSPGSGSHAATACASS